MTNSKSTKRALVSSALAILMCVAMLIGTTFAWFTDTASTAVNKIQAGKLDIALEMKNAGGNWVNAEGETLGWVAEDNRAQDEIFWEPGCTYKLPTLKITNKGNLALQFKILINNISGDLELLNALEFTCTYAACDETWATDFEPVQGSDMVNLPFELPVYHDTDIEEAFPYITGTALPPYSEEAGYDQNVVYYTIKAHMKESAGNEYQGLELKNMAITVVATQVTAENDSYGNTYDKDAEYAIPVSTPADLAAALASGNDVILTAPVQMPNVIEISGDVTIYGSENGKLIAPDNGNRFIKVNDNTGPVTLTLSGVDVVGPTTGTDTRGVSVYNNRDVTIIVDNSSVSASYYALNIANQNDRVNVVVKNTTLTGWCAFQTWSAGTKATFENCTLIGNNDKAYNAGGWNNFATVVINENVPNTELTFKNCRIEANQTTGNKQYLLSVRAHNANVTLDGCTFFANGTEIADEDFSHYLEIYYADLVLTIDGEVIPIS